MIPVVRLRALTVAFALCGCGAPPTVPAGIDAVADAPRDDGPITAADGAGADLSSIPVDGADPGEAMGAGRSPDSVGSPDGGLVGADTPRTPQPCPTGAPPQGSLVPADPPSSDAQCPLPPWSMAKSGAATLAIEIGDYGPTGFSRWASGAWRPIVHGPQGGIHVTAALRVSRFNAKPIGMCKLLIERVGQVGCAIVTATEPFAAGGAVVAADPGTVAAAGTAGVMYILPVPGALSWQYCGRWMRLVARVRLPDGAWGEAASWIRLFDT